MAKPIKRTFSSSRNTPLSSTWRPPPPRVPTADEFYVRRTLKTPPILKSEEERAAARLALDKNKNATSAKTFDFSNSYYAGDEDYIKAMAPFWKEARNESTFGRVNLSLTGEQRAALIARRMRDRRLYGVGVSKTAAEKIGSSFLGVDIPIEKSRFESIDDLTYAIKHGYLENRDDYMTALDARNTGPGISAAEPSYETTQNLLHGKDPWAGQSIHDTSDRASHKKYLNELRNQGYQGWERPPKGLNQKALKAWFREHPTRFDQRLSQKINRGIVPNLNNAFLDVETIAAGNRNRAYIAAFGSLESLDKGFTQFNRAYLPLELLYGEEMIENVTSMTKRGLKGADLAAQSRDFLERRFTSDFMRTAESMGYPQGHESLLNEVLNYHREAWGGNTNPLAPNRIANGAAAEDFLKQLRPLGLSTLNENGRYAARGMALTGWNLPGFDIPRMYDMLDITENSVRANMYRRGGNVTHMQSLLDEVVASKEGLQNSIYINAQTVTSSPQFNAIIIAEQKKAQSVGNRSRSRFLSQMSGKGQYKNTEAAKILGIQRRGIFRTAHHPSTDIALSHAILTNLEARPEFSGYFNTTVERLVETQSQSTYRYNPKARQQFAKGVNAQLKEMGGEGTLAGGRFAGVRVGGVRHVGRNFVTDLVPGNITGPIAPSFDPAEKLITKIRTAVEYTGTNPHKLSEKALAIDALRSGKLNDSVQAENMIRRFAWDSSLSLKTLFNEPGYMSPGIKYSTITGQTLRVGEVHLGDGGPLAAAIRLSEATHSQVLDTFAKSSVNVMEQVYGQVAVGEREASVMNNRFMGGIAPLERLKGSLHAQARRQMRLTNAERTALGNLDELLAGDIFSEIELSFMKGGLTEMGPGVNNLAKGWRRVGFNKAINMIESERQGKIKEFGTVQKIMEDRLIEANIPAARQEELLNIARNVYHPEMGGASLYGTAGRVSLTSDLIRNSMVNAFPGFGIEAREGEPALSALSNLHRNVFDTMGMHVGAGATSGITGLPVGGPDGAWELSRALKGMSEADLNSLYATDDVRGLVDALHGAESPGHLPTGPLRVTRPQITALAAAVTSRTGVPLSTESIVGDLFSQSMLDIGMRLKTFGMSSDDALYEAFKDFRGRDVLADRIPSRGASTAGQAVHNLSYAQEEADLDRVIRTVHGDIATATSKNYDVGWAVRQQLATQGIVDEAELGDMAATARGYALSKEGKLHLGTIANANEEIIQLARELENTRGQYDSAEALAQQAYVEAVAPFEGRYANAPKGERRARKARLVRAREEAAVARDTMLAPTLQARDETQRRLSSSIAAQMFSPESPIGVGEYSTSLELRAGVARTSGVIRNRYFQSVGSGMNADNDIIYALDNAAASLRNTGAVMPDMLPVSGIPGNIFGLKAKTVDGSFERISGVGYIGPEGIELESGGILSATHKGTTYRQVIGVTPEGQYYQARAIAGGPLEIAYAEGSVPVIRGQLPIKVAGVRRGTTRVVVPSEATMETMAAQVTDEIGSVARQVESLLANAGQSVPGAAANSLRRENRSMFKAFQDVPTKWKVLAAGAAAAMAVTMLRRSQPLMQQDSMAYGSGPGGMPASMGYANVAPVSTYMGTPPSQGMRASISGVVGPNVDASSLQSLVGSMGFANMNFNDNSSTITSAEIDRMISDRLA